MMWNDKVLTMDEVWKDIDGYEGLYQVSNLGNVRSLNWGNRGCIKNLYLKPHIKGYLQVELHKNAKRKMFTVHRLVALHFVDGYAANKVVNHKNENKHDNRADNLEWCTTSQNIRYSMELHPTNNRKRLKGKAFLCEEPIVQMTADNHFIRVWKSAISIKSELGYNDWSIKECCKGKRHTAYGYKWRYAI